MDALLTGVLHREKMGDIISTLEGIPQMFSHVFAVEISTVLPGEVQATGM